MKQLAIFCLVYLASGFCKIQAQEKPTLGPNDTIVVALTKMEDGRWLPTSGLPEAFCNGKMSEAMKEKMKAWTRLRNAVYVTYPYALQAGKVINEINIKLAGITDPKARKKIIKEREKDLRKTFSDKLTNLSVYQGKVLMKLINRQSGNNCYEILKEYKGGFDARLYQTIAFFFGSNLKQSYDAKGEDAEIESIVKDVEKLYRFS